MELGKVLLPDTTSALCIRPGKNWNEIRYSVICAIKYCQIF